MKKTLFTVLAVLCAINLWAAKAIRSQEETKKFLRAMELTVDPDNIGKNITSFEVHFTASVPQVKININTVTFYKKPNKIKEEVSVEGLGKTTIYFDGQKGWRTSLLSGVEPIEGNELAEYKIVGALSNPTAKLDDVFDKIEIAEALEEYEGKKFVVLYCSFTPEKKLFPRKMLVDPDTKLVIYQFSKTHTASGVVESITKNLEFKKINGIIVPVRFIQQAMKMQMVADLKRFIINKHYPDNFFSLYKK